MKRKLTLGTSHFVDKRAAYRYYSDYGYDHAAVDLKFKREEIHTGEPLLQKGDILSVNRKEGRYFITR